MTIKQAIFRMKEDIMPEKYVILFLMIIMCGICVMFWGICREPLLALLIVGLIIAICTIIFFMLDNH